MPTKFETEENAFRVAPSKDQPANNDPFSVPSTKPERHPFEIEAPELIEPEPKTEIPEIPEPQPNDFNIRSNSDSNPKKSIEPQAASSPNREDQEFVPLSSSSNSRVSARTTFQVQVEPATTPEPLAQETFTPKPQAQSFKVDPAQFKPIPPIEMQATTVQSKPSLDFQGLKPQTTSEPTQVLESNDFLKQMPTSPTCLESDRCQSQEVKPTELETAPPIVFNEPRNDSEPPLELTKIPEPESDLVPKAEPPSTEPPSAWNADSERNRELRRDEAIQRGVYRVSQNETLWSIAQTVYGDGRLFRALYELNRNQIPDPNVVSTGTNILTPPLSELVANWEDEVPVDLRPTPVDANTYITKKGDTLFHVARLQLGQASRFDELMELNQSRLNLDTHHLTELPAGMTLQLPAVE